MNVDVERANEFSSWLFERIEKREEKKPLKLCLTAKTKDYLLEFPLNQFWHDEKQRRTKKKPPSDKSELLKEKKSFFHLILFRESLKFVLIMSGSYNFFKRKKSSQFFSFRFPTHAAATHPQSHHNFHSQIWLIIKI